MEDKFWKKKQLSDFTDEEWEAICDGCGKCCYRKYISGTGKKAMLHYTKVACDFLDLKTNRCTVYETRFSDCPDCEKLTRKKLSSCSWLPDSCAYRILAEGKELPPWHPLVSEDPKAMQKNQIYIRGGIHEKDCDDWANFILASEKYR